MKKRAVKLQLKRALLARKLNLVQTIRKSIKPDGGRRRKMAGRAVRRRLLLERKRKTTMTIYRRAGVEIYATMVPTQRLKWLVLDSYIIRCAGALVTWVKGSSFLALQLT
jgi:hypothetical protein